MNKFIPLSALNHFLYCPRRCALIHLEQIWIENRFTAEGRVLHERADTVRAERRKNVRTVSAMPLSDDTLGISGVADVVEFHKTPEGEHVYPVEYKRGRPKAHRADEVQLCAQALCLETMLDTHVNGGALFYGKTRRRKEVIFDEELRALTHQVITETRTLINNGKTPAAHYDAKRCDACSLIDICQPKLSGKRNVDQWLRQELAEELLDHAPPT